MSCSRALQRGAATRGVAPLRRSLALLLTFTIATPSASQASPGPAQQTDPAPVTQRTGGVAASRVLGKSDKKMVDGTTACVVRFAYGGQPPEIMLWDEPCSNVTAGMIDRDKLEALGWWAKLDSFARGFIADMPGGRVLYISGKFSASVFPVGTSGTPYEVEVAD